MKAEIGALFDRVENALAQGDCGCHVDGAHRLEEPDTKTYPYLAGLKVCDGKVALDEIRSLSGESNPESNSGEHARTEPDATV